MQGAVMDMGNDLISQREKSIFMGFFVFVDMDRGYFKGLVAVGFDLLVADAFIVLLDVDHQHV